MSAALRCSQSRREPCAYDEFRSRPVTLLLSFYSSSGIVFAADSAITQSTANKAAVRKGKQRKLLKVSTVGVNGAIVGFFGLAVVGTEPMDTWLARKLRAWAGGKTAAELGDYLRDELSREVPDVHRLNNASGLHIGAFERRGQIAVPVMQYVTNIYHLDTITGVYSDFREYRSEEHFPSHPSPESSWTLYPANQLRRHLQEYERGHGFPHWFRNGDLAFSARPWEGLRDAVNSLRGDLRHRGLKSPEDLRLWSALAKTIVTTVGDLYGILGTQGAPLIEGPYVTESLAWP